MHLDIHLEYCDDSGEKLTNLAKTGKPFTISPVPVLLTPEHESFKNGIYTNYSYPKKIVEILREILQEPQITLGQQGYTHFCGSCFGKKEKKDPWHENACLYQDSFSIEKQMEVIKTGKNILEEKFNVSPVLYVPPNHQFDQNTKMAAKKLGFKYFALQGILNICPYSEGGLVVLPERKFGKNGKIFYIHYDHVKDKSLNFMNILEKSNALNEIDFTEKPNMAPLNDYLVVLKKRARDWKKYF
jgi:hypothetical protein